MPIQPDSVWRYSGPSPGSGELHKVIFSDKLHTTTIAPTHSWHGETVAFPKSFTLVKNAPK